MELPATEAAAAAEEMRKKVRLETKCFLQKKMGKRGKGKTTRDGAPPKAAFLSLPPEYSTFV